MVTRPEEIPNTPGCYRFIAADGRVVYVGKAKSLRQRLSSYFPADITQLHPRTQAMLAEAHTVTWVELPSEEEALLVEAALIRQLQPPYNIRLRDDHAYPSLLLTAHDIPRIQLWHGPPPKTGRLFGPYPSPSHARDLQEAIAHVCGVRPCRDGVLRRHQRIGRACLLGETGRCAAPCVNLDGYDTRVRNAVTLLCGDVSEAKVQLRARMQAAAADRAFEAAGRHRDALGAVERLESRKLATAIDGAVAATAAVCDELGAAAQVLLVRDGTLIACPTFLVDRALLSENGEVTEHVAVEYALAAAFSPNQPPPPLIATNAAVSAELVSSLTQLAGRKVTNRVPQRGPLVDLVELATANARSALLRARRQRAADADARRSELAALADAVGLAGAPLRIECVDISHLHGEQTVAAFAVLEEGIAQPSRHRVFHLDSGNDDYASMRLAIRKRCAAWRAQAEKPASQRDIVLGHLPQLLVVDGGMQQLAAVVLTLEEEGVDIPAVSLAKRLEEVFLPGKPAPLRLPLDSPALFVLQRARDAAHVTSVKAQRKRRAKKLTASTLDTIPGLGQKRRERLSNDVGSERKLAALPRDKYPTWLPANVADAIWNAYHPHDTTARPHHNAGEPKETSDSM